MVFLGTISMLNTPLNHLLNEEKKSVKASQRIT